MEFAALLKPVLESTAASIVREIINRVTGNKIRITSPRPGETAQNPIVMDGGELSYEVKGRLKRLPDGYRIWLLIEDERQRLFWPQGFFPVKYNPDLKEWEGRVNSFGGPDHKVVAVVAPPTSSEFFSYYEQAGLDKGKFVSLPSLPAECSNRDYVQAKFPPRSLDS